MVRPKPPRLRLADLWTTGSDVAGRLVALWGVGAAIVAGVPVTLAALDLIGWGSAAGAVGLGTVALYAVAWRRKAHEYYRALVEATKPVPWTPENALRDARRALQMTCDQIETAGECMDPRTKDVVDVFAPLLAAAYYETATRRLERVCDLWTNGDFGTLARNVREAFEGLGVSDVNPSFRLTAEVLAQLRWRPEEPPPEVFSQDYGR
jgi:hypothetical protein